MEDYTTPQAGISQQKLNSYLESLKNEQNFGFAVIASLAAMLVSALLWAAITVATEYQIGYMAIAVGLVIGFAIRFSGKGLDRKFGILGGAMALLGCLLGNIFSIIGFIAKAEALSYGQVISMMDFSVLPALMAETFSVMDLLFYGIAIYEGYRFSFRQITEEEIVLNASEDEENPALPEETGPAPVIS